MSFPQLSGNWSVQEVLGLLRRAPVGPVGAGVGPGQCVRTCQRASPLSRGKVAECLPRRAEVPENTAFLPLAPFCHAGASVAKLAETWPGTPAAPSGRDRPLLQE